MWIAGVALALVGLSLLIPALIVGIQLAVGDLNIDTRNFRRGLIVSTLGLGCIVTGLMLVIRTLSVRVRSRDRLPGN